MPTVIIGSARDIVEQCGVPRFVFTDYPLGNPIGRPDDVAMQRTVLTIALDLLTSAKFPRTTVQAPFQWDEIGEWRATYMQVDE